MQNTMNFVCDYKTTSHLSYNKLGKFLVLCRRSPTLGFCCHKTLYKKTSSSSSSSSSMGQVDCPVPALTHCHHSLGHPRSLLPRGLQLRACFGSLVLSIFFEMVDPVLFVLGSYILYSTNLQFFPYYIACNFVVQWSEFLATDTEVPGSIPGTARFF